MSSPEPHGLDLQITVPFSYRLRFTDDAFDPKNHTLRSLVASGEGAARTLVFIDDGVSAAWPTLLKDIRRYVSFNSETIDLIGEPQVLPGGEKAKNSREVVETVLSAIDAGALCRHSFVIAIGGGALLDAVGFAAATAHRGVRLIRLPTTTLAQADAGVGLKNGINAMGKKNFLGSFAPPWAVVNDQRFLSTLSERDWKSGFAEAIKVALLKDAGFFAEIESVAGSLADRDERFAFRILRRAAELHIDHIVRGGDPFEMLSSRPLDFGHWSAHKLEEMSGFRIRHGEAVAIGVALDTIISMVEQRLSSTEAHRILSCIHSMGLSLYHMLLGNTDALYEGMEQFRQHLGGRLAITLLEGIGQPVEVHTVSLDVIRKAVRYLASYMPARTSPDLFLEEPGNRATETG